MLVEYHRMHPKNVQRRHPAAIAYIHENPVRRGLCIRSTDWRWSSARHYYGDELGILRGDGSPTIRGLTWDFYA
jgi:hypothetical protein